MEFRFMDRRVKYVDKSFDVQTDVCAVDRSRRVADRLQCVITGNQIGVNRVVCS